uniref:Uncharacterized protein n=1 Tax=Rhodococcus sp. NS1 TaxID=402236 RepID=A0A097SQA4_9NOCA|nr:hypothetical protein LRS1606.266 [Rhodococcus sp. NS1]
MVALRWLIDLVRAREKYCVCLRFAGILYRRRSFPHPRDYPETVCEGPAWPKRRCPCLIRRKLWARRSLTPAAGEIIDQSELAERLLAARRGICVADC